MLIVSAQTRHPFKINVFLLNLWRLIHEIDLENTFWVLYLEKELRCYELSFAYNYKFFGIDYFHQQDRNDFTPSFERTSYSADSVKETEAPGFQIAQVKAEDEDPEV